MLKSLIIKIIVLLLPSALWAQYSEIGVFGGGTNFIGDVGNYSIHLPRDYSLGAFYRYNFNRYWSLRLGGYYGNIENDDALSNLDYRNERNLSFQSEIWEVNSWMEFNFFKFEPGTKHKQTPYIFGGIGVFWYNPKTEYQGELVALRPLGTEGQGTSIGGSKYAKASRYVVFGMGYKLAIGRLTSIAIETSFRPTNTDYLDDVSGLYADPTILAEQNGALAAALSDRSLSGSDKTNSYRGNPNNNDWYIYTGITLQIKFEDFYEKCSNFAN